MKHNTKWLATVIAVASGLMAANSARADVTIETFDNFTAKRTLRVMGDAGGHNYRRSNELGSCLHRLREPVEIRGRHQRNRTNQGSVDD